MSHRRQRIRTSRTFQHRAVRGLRFERLERREMLAADYGDAAGYPSASHEAVGPLLGLLRDSNAEVLNTLANGDAADEDGVAFGVLRAGQSATVTVHVANAPAGAKLNAWIDFNRDRDFIDADERIIANLSVVAGDNVVAFTVPATVVGGANYARFRLNTAGSSGAPLDGEVEDYLIPIADADSGIFGGQQPIGVDGVDQIAVVDLDGDGDADILNDLLKWRSNTHGRFGPQTATGVTPVSGRGLLAPADVDGDGDMDFFADYSGVVWYENNGLETFARRAVEANVTPFGLAAVDLDGDGDVDLISASGQSTVDWYVNDGNQVFNKTAIASQLGAVQFVSVHDLDGDGDPDILAGTPGSPNSTLRWLENDGQQNFTVRTLATARPSLSDVAVGDFDEDGDLDVVASFTASGGIVFYANDGAETFTPTNLDAASWSASAIDVADLDADGDLDVAASGSSRVAWYENDGAAFFTRRVVAAAPGTHLGVTAADVNGDGRLDLVTTGTGSTPLAWYEQLAGMGDDFGDAPRPYRVFAQDQGPRHRAVGPQLGPTRDAEPDGAHHATGAELDDGVLFGALSLSQSTGTVTVNVQNAPAGAKLDAWLDFDGDGSWGREGEQIATSLSVVEGDNTLTIVLPSWAVAGATYARFRLSTAGGLGPLGAALDGEVEDHPVVIADRAPATGVFEQPQPVGSGYDFMIAADVDGDGDADVVAKGGAFLIWSENLGLAGFAAHSVAMPGPPGQAILGGDEFTAGDLDSDGDLDFVGFGVVQQQQVLWWAENDGAQNFTRRTFTLTGVPSVIVALAMADVDADGDLDILAAAEESGIYLLVNDGRQEFTARFIGRLGTLAVTVVAADVDQDGDLDIVAGGKGDPALGAQYSYDAGWFQNNGDLQFAWRGIQLRTIPGTASGSAQSVAVGDVDGDGDLDIVSAGVGTGSATTLWWHEQLANQTFVSHSLEVERNFRWATLADFDVDGDLDIVATGDTRTVGLYENLSGGRFLRRQITATLDTGYSSAAADIDSDGDLDLVVMHATARGLISWFENVNLVDPDYGDAPAPYPSTQSVGGAYHNGGGPRLGASRTSEADGVASAGADADVGDDGVEISSLQVGQTLASVTVNVQNSPAGAKLDAWIDFNGDGSWAGAGEQIFASYEVVEGDNTLTFRIPASAVAGATVARFRLSTAGGLRTGGAALDGEVEDYSLVIAPPAPATGEYLIGVYLGPSFRSIQTADIDGDGDADYLAANGSASLAWYENLGDGAFLTHSRNLALPGYALNARPIDLDGDGDVDFALVTSNGIAWLKNDGLQNFAYQAATPTASYSLSGVFDLADVDGDGDLDALAALSAASTQSIILFRNDGQNFTASTKLTTINVAASAIRAADVDRDGDIDFAVTFEGSNSTGGVAWYENAGGAWTLHDVTLNSPTEPRRGGRDVVSIDFDFDGDVDLVASTYASSIQLGLEIFRNDGNQNFVRETLATIASSSEGYISQARGGRLQVADLDGDGDYDAVFGGNRSIRLYTNQGAAGFLQSTLNEVFSTSGAVVAIGDMDGDRRLEILAAYSSAGGVIRFDDRPFGDYDRNGVVDQADRDLYEATLGQPAVPPGSGADGDRSGVVDTADLAIWEANQGASAVPPLKAADFNGDERIDGNDFLMWQRWYGATSSVPGSHPGDIDYSGVVDAGDLAAWKRHFNGGVAPPVTAAARVAAVASVIAPANTTAPTSETTAAVSAVPEPAPAITVAPPTLEPTTVTLPPVQAGSSPWALPADVVLALPVEKLANKKPDAHLLKRNSTAPRDAAFASLAVPALIPLRHQRLITELSLHAPENQETALEITAARSDLDGEFAANVLDR